MGLYGLNALIATSPENITYLSDYSSLAFSRSRGTQFYAILPPEISEATLIVPIGELPVLAEKPSWIENIRTYGIYHIARPAEAKLRGAEKRLDEMRRFCPNDEMPIQALVRALQEKGLAKGRLGLDELNMNSSRMNELREASPQASFISASEIFQEIRMIKTTEELERVRISSQINEEALRAMMGLVREGVTQREFYEYYRRSVTARGAELRLWSCGHGTASVDNFPPTQVKMKRGDIIRFDTGCIYASYFSDTGRTGVLGEPNQKLVDRYRAIAAGMREALALVKPGVMASSVFDATIRVVCQEGMAGYRRHHCGHSIGLEDHEPPLIASSSSLPGFKDYPLEKGMVLCMEVPYYELGFGGIQIEDTILVTEDGYQCITCMERDIFRF